MMTTIFSVEFNFDEYQRPMEMKMGFNIRSEAKRWAEGNTTDGVVQEWQEWR